MTESATAGETGAIDANGQPVRLYPRPAVNTYVTDGGSQVTYLIPTDDLLADRWRAVDFDDSGVWPW